MWEKSREVTSKLFHILTTQALSVFTCHSLLGIDISRTRLNLLALRNHKGKYRIQQALSIPLAEGTWDGKSLVEPQKVTQLLLEGLSQMPHEIHCAAIALPYEEIITKRVSVVEGLQHSDLEEEILFQAEKNIPFSLDKISLDYESLGPSPKEPKKEDFLLVAALKESLHQRIDMVEKAGLKVKIVDIEQYAIARAGLFGLRQTMGVSGLSNQTIAIITFKENLLSLIIVNQSEVVYHYGEICHPLNSDNLSHPKNLILRGIELFSSSEKYKKIDSIFISKSFEKFFNASGWLENALNAKIYAVDVLNLTPFESETARTLLPEENDTFLTAFGLALRRFDDPN